jgi:hypothetical protein
MTSATTNDTLERVAAAAREILELQEREHDEDGEQGDDYDPQGCSPEPGISPD